MICRCVDDCTFGVLVIGMGNCSVSQVCLIVGSMFSIVLCDILLLVCCMLGARCILDVRLICIFE